MSLRESLRQQTEAAVDNLRKRRESVAAELEEIDEELTEARALLRVIVNGKIEAAEKPKRSRLNLELVTQVLEDMPDEFNNAELADALGLASSGARSWGVTLVKKGYLRDETMPRGSKTPTKYWKIHG